MVVVLIWGINNAKRQTARKGFIMRYWYVERREGIVYGILDLGECHSLGAAECRAVECRAAGSDDDEWEDWYIEVE